MRKNKKNIGFLLIGLGLIIIALVIYLVFFNKESTPPPIIPDDVYEPGAVLPGADDNAPPETITEGDRPRKDYNPDKEVPHEINENDAAKLARVFVEGFGTFSSYSNYANFEDLKLFMTPNMKTWAANHVKELKSKTVPGEEHYGVSTRAVSTKVQNYDKSSATILITTQRLESHAELRGEDPYMQDIVVSLKNIDGRWLVDSAFWQEK